MHRGSSSLKELAKNTLAESKKQNAPDASTYSAALESAHHMAGSGTAKKPQTLSRHTAVRDSPPDRGSDFREREEENPSDDLLFDALTSMNTDLEPISQLSTSAVKTQAHDGKTVWQVPPGLSDEPDSNDESPSDELLFDALADLVSSPPVSRSSKVLPTVSNREHDILGQILPLAIE